MMLNTKKNIDVSGTSTKNASKSISLIKVCFALHDIISNSILLLLLTVHTTQNLLFQTSNLTATSRIKTIHNLFTKTQIKIREQEILENIPDLFKHSSL